MARFIKANPKVAAYLGLEKDRNTAKDGNYLLWQADMLKFGPLTRLGETLERTGAIALLPHEAREEQDGTVIRPLPIATDPQFIVDIAAGKENALANSGNGAETEEGAAGAESPAESVETPGNEETETNRKTTKA